MKKIKKITFNKKKSIVFLTILFIFIIIFLLFKFRSGLDKVEITKHDLYQYLIGLKVEYTGEITIEKETDDVSNLKIKGERIELDSNPIYFADEAKTLFPTNMGIIFPMHGSQYKINYYSTIYKDVDDYYLKDRTLKRKINNAIIYDGDDLYYILDESDVTFGDKKIHVSPMSFVIADYRNKEIYVYNYKDDDMQIFKDISDEVVIQTDNYKVNASLDYMYYNNKTRLFIKNIDVLKNVKNNK